MLWLELSLDPVHGGGEWGFGKCLWSPTRKKGAANVRWAFWESLLRVKVGDSVLHLRETKTGLAFVGMSVCCEDGFVTDERPPESGEWSTSDKFYRVRLSDYVEFSDPILLADVFRKKRDELVAYFRQNSERSRDRHHLFYVIQRGKLQCLQGAYLSEVDKELAELLLGGARGVSSSASYLTSPVVSTGEAARQIIARVGQDEFSAFVKRNFESRCCVPGCEVDDPLFLVGAHIARWADVPEMRGDIRNGLCLCLMHDNAFERGHFTLDQNLEIVVPDNIRKSSKWAAQRLLPIVGERISESKVRPSREALQHHWLRHEFKELLPSADQQSDNRGSQKRPS